MRVQPSEVIEILPATTGLCDADLQPLITTASIMVDCIAEDCASGLSEDKLAQIEKYLAAHLAAIKEFSLNMTTEKDACSGATATYGWKLGKGIEGTPFGQTANMLSKGCLASAAVANDTSDEAPQGAINFFSLGCR